MNEDVIRNMIKNGESLARIKLTMNSVVGYENANRILHHVFSEMGYVKDVDGKPMIGYYCDIDEDGIVKKIPVNEGRKTAFFLPEFSV